MDSPQSSAHMSVDFEIDTQLNPPIFEATLAHDSAASMVKLMNAILVPEKTLSNCLFKLTHEGIKIILPTGRTLQATVTLPKQLFHPYDLYTTDDSIDLYFNVKTLINSMSIHTDCPGEETSFPCENGLEVPFKLEFRLEDKDAPLILITKSADVETHCELNTITTGVDVPFFSPTDAIIVTSQLVIEVIDLAEIWSLFYSGLKDFKLSVNKDSLEFSMEGTLGYQAIEINKDHDGVERFISDLRSPAKWGYRADQMRSALRPITPGIQTSTATLTTTSEGFLMLHYQIDINDSDIAFIDYVLRPQGESGDPGEQYTPIRSET